MTKSRLVIFDICGTLFFSNTSFDFLDLIVQAKSYSLFRKVSKTIFARIINPKIRKQSQWQSQLQ